MKLGPYELGPNDTPENGIYVGDARLLSSVIPDESVDLIFTDPPYQKRYLGLYGWLSTEAARVLKPTGFALVYAGVYWKATVLERLTTNLEYFWDFASINRQNSPIVWHRRIISRYKSILAFRKCCGTGLPVCNVLGMWVGGGEDKRYHTWGQDESTARYYIDCFSQKSELIWDPFCGGGTTCAVCSILGRKYLGFDIDEEAVLVARQRLQQRQPLLPDIYERQSEMVL